MVSVVSISISCRAHLEFPQSLISALRINPHQSTQLQDRNDLPSDPVLNSPVTDAAAQRILGRSQQPARDGSARFVADTASCARLQTTCLCHFKAGLAGQNFMSMGSFSEMSPKSMVLTSLSNREIRPLWDDAGRIKRKSSVRAKSDSNGVQKGVNPGSRDPRVELRKLLGNINRSKRFRIIHGGVGEKPTDSRARPRGSYVT